MAESNNRNTGIVPVDVGRLSSGLQTMFNGMSEVFGSIGAGEEAVAMISAGGTGGKPEVSHAVEQVPKKTSAAAKPTESVVLEQAKAEASAKAPKKAETSAAETKASTLTFADIQKIAGTKILADRGNQEKIQKIISSFGITKLSDLPENKYEAFMTQLTRL